MALEAENAALKQAMRQQQDGDDRPAWAPCIENDIDYLRTELLSARQRIAALEAQIEAAQDDAARLRAAVEQITWEHNCPWCGESHGKHATSCQRQAALAQASEVKLP